MRDRLPVTVLSGLLGAGLSRTDETLVEMTNGCICCTLREDLLAEEGRFDHLVIEGTRIAEPLPVAATFEFRDEGGASLSDVARLDTMVTVVDAVRAVVRSLSADATVVGTNFGPVPLGAVLDPARFDPARHRALPDPFPAWGAADAA